MKEQKIQELLEEISKLFPVYSERYPTMAFADLFGLGCYLISTGKTSSGRKAVDTVTDGSQGFADEMIEDHKIRSGFSEGSAGGMQCA